MPSGVPLDAETLEAMRLEYARNGRNVQRVADKWSVDRKTVAAYRDEQQWDKWADDLQEATNRKMLAHESDVNAKILGAALIGIDKCKAAIKEARTHGLSISEFASALEKFNKIAQLLCGNPTDRLSVDVAAEFVKGLDPDAKREFAKKLRGE